MDGAAVVGFIYILSDGEVQAYIASMAVAETHRRRGIGTSLIEHAAKAADGERVDLLSAEDGFYERLVHKRRSGFRLPLSAVWDVSAPRTPATAGFRRGQPTASGL